MAKRRIELKFRVIGKPWELRCVGKKAYEAKKARANSVAMTYYHKRKIVLSPSGTDLESIIHELTHAYLYELCTHSADLDVDAQNEIFCELMAKRGRELLNLAEILEGRVRRALGE